MSAELDRARAIVGEIAPGKHPEYACMLIGSAIAGMRGLGMRHIRIGSLFWPERFRDDPYLSMRGGWGCEGYSEADKILHLAGVDVDEDGGFSGHTWIEPEPETVVDLMHDNEESAREIYNADYETVARYIPRPSLERAVKRFWRVEMLRAIKLGRKHQTNGAPTNAET